MQMERFQENIENSNECCGIFSIIVNLLNIIIIWQAFAIWCRSTEAQRITLAHLQFN